MHRIFRFGSRRTRHLSLSLRDKVIDLGLTKEDVEKLNLPPQPEAPKYRKYRPMRWELSALSVLTIRYGIQNPLLSYTVAKLTNYGIKLSPLPIDKESLLKVELSLTLSTLLSKIADNVIAEILHQAKIDGKAVDLKIKIPDIVNGIEDNKELKR